MRGGLALLVACGCNSVFELPATQLIDGPPPDAPFACPAVGTPLRFSEILSQFMTRSCSHYMESASAELSTAYCSDTLAIEEGPIGGELAPVAITPNSTAYASLYEPRLSPEGDELWVHQWVVIPVAFTFEVYRRTAPGTWTWASTLPVPQAGFYEAITAPTARAFGPRRAVLRRQDHSLQELVETDSTWQVVQSYPATTLGLASVEGPLLTEDGLRVMFVGKATPTSTLAMFYLERASTSVDFGTTPIEVPSAPTATDGYLTPNCSRLYVSGLGAVFFAPQQL